MNERTLEMLKSTVERLLRREATDHLVNILTKSHPADLSHMLKLMPVTQAEKVFLLLPSTDMAAQVLSEMEIGFRQEFLGQLEMERLVEIFLVMADDDVVDILDDLPFETREKILEMMPAEETADVNELLSYAEDTAGRIMTTDFLTLPETITTRKAIEEIRKASEKEMVFYLYITYEDGKLAGVISLRQLVTAPDEQTLAKLMSRDVISVHVDIDREEAAHMVSRYNLLAIPVVDHNGILVGIITVDDIIDVLREEATEDILKMAGTTGEEITSFSSLKSARVRLPWLFASWVGGVAAMSIIASFEGSFKSQATLFASLAAFIPVIMGMGGNIGTQSLSITVRGLATGRLNPALIRQIVFKEMRVGLILGLAYGLLLAGVGWFINHSVLMGLVVGISICANMTLAALVGAFLPLLAQRFNIDPAVASGPFVTTSIDILGISLFFMTAYLLLV